MKAIVMSDEQKAEMQRLKKLKELFWTQKLGYYPTKIEKVGRVVKFGEFDREKEQLDKEFELFLKEHSK